jgi:ribosomal protein S11
MDRSERASRRLELFGITSIALMLVGCTLTGQLDVAMGAAALTLLGAGFVVAAVEDRTPSVAATTSPPEIERASP